MSSKITIIGAGSVGSTIASLPETTKMLGILTSLSSHTVLPVNQDRQDLNLHRQM